MTNFWIGVDVEKLCDQHLLGLHKEIHQEAGTLENHPYGEAIVQGHWCLGQVSMEKVGVRHQEAVEEMNRRGMNHDSPLNFDEPSVFQSWTIGFPFEAMQKISLSNRCEECQV